MKLNGYSPLGLGCNLTILTLHRCWIVSGAVWSNWNLWKPGAWLCYCLNWLVIKLWIGAFQLLTLSLHQELRKTGLFHHLIHDLFLSFCTVLLGNCYVVSDLLFLECGLITGCIDVVAESQNARYRGMGKWIGFGSIKSGKFHGTSEWQSEVPGGHVKQGISSVKSYTFFLPLLLFFVFVFVCFVCFFF